MHQKVMVTALVNSMFLLTCWIPALGTAEPAPGPPLSQLAQFAQSPTWLRALHFDHVGHRSRVDDPEFFMHPQGKADALAELQASIQILGQRQVARETLCKRVHRYQLLQNQGWVPPRQLHQLCPRYAAFVEQVGGQQVSLVFVSHFSGNPASVMGHTFLAFHNKSLFDSGDASLSFNDTIVNFAAQVPSGTNMLAYIAGGISGGFQGRFSLYRYSSMVELYNDSEGRDIHTYPLKLSHDQRAALLTHTYEMMETSSYDYYFFDENCSMQILALLEAAVPESHLLRRLPFYVTPIETIKAAIAEDLLDAKPLYTPAPLRRLNHQLSKAAAGEQQEFYQNWQRLEQQQQLQPTSSGRQTDLLLAALDYQKHRDDGETSDSHQQNRQQLLAWRVHQRPASVTRWSQPPPHHSHGDSRLSTGASSRANRTLAHWRFRPALHELLSPQIGYETASALHFSTVELAYEEQLWLQQWTLLRYSKLGADAQRVFGTTFAWDFHLGASRPLPEDGTSGLVDGFVGWTQKLGGSHLFLGPRLARNPNLSPSPLIGGQVGVFKNLTAKARLSGTSYLATTRSQRWSWFHQAGLAYEPSKSQSARVFAVYNGLRSSPWEAGFDYGFHF